MPRSRPPGPSRAARWLVLGCLAALAGCRRTTLVALPSKDARVVTDFAAKTTEHEVSIEAHLHAWRGEPRGLERRATSVHVRLENHGDTPLRISRSAFELLSGTARFPSVAPERIEGAPEWMTRDELAPSTLAPGESVSGYLYFVPVTGEWGFVRLRTMLLDESRALLGSIDLPFGSGHVQRCSLAYVDRRESAASSILFRTCLAPF